MRVTFLGGADEIGASCALLELDQDIRVLVDCGQRLGVSSGQELPDFSQLEFGNPLTAIVLTHAHTDHVGGLPALEPFLSPDCKIFGTEPTLDLARVMLQDSVRIAARHRQGDGQLPLFPAKSLEGTLARMTPVRWGKPVSLSEHVRATWFPSGHLLGAAMIEIRDREESALFSGDVSIADASTITGAFVPAIQPKILVLESTYGNRLHVHRPTQERKIVERVRECLAAGGHVLFPAFALGRAQEVLAILGNAMRREELEPFPIYADGMVREVSRVYGRHAPELSSECRRLAEQGLDPIFPDDLTVRPVRSNSEREEIAKGPPCVVVASGGMLQGGASQFYATQWISEPNSLILITGYQDEESPGEALLNLAKLSPGEPRFFKLGGVQTPVACGIESFSLSAHADHVELTAMASKLSPQLTLLVHGSPEARETLARGIHSSAGLKVATPLNGESFETGRARPRSLRSRPVSRINPLALWPPWDPLAPRELDLQQIHSWLVTLTPRPGWVTVEELAELWKNPEPVTTVDVQDVRTAIAAQALPMFVPDRRRGHLLHIAPPENLTPRMPSGQRIPAEQIPEIVRNLFPADAGPLRIGCFPEDNLLELEFRFPRATAAKLLGLLGEIENRTGWHVRIREQTLEADLTAAFDRLFAEHGATVLEICHTKARLLAQASTTDELAQRTRRFQIQTGYRLEWPHSDVDTVCETTELGQQ